MNQTWILNTKSGTWTQGPSMRLKRSYHGCFSVKTNNTITEIYVIGGIIQQSGAAVSTEVLNVQNLTWSDGPSLPFGMYGLKAVASVQDEYVGFVVGGNGNGEPLNTIFGLKKSNKNLSWIEIGRTNMMRYHHAVVNAPLYLMPFCVRNSSCCQVSYIYYPSKVFQFVGKFWK